MGTADAAIVGRADGIFVGKADGFTLGVLEVISVVGCDVGSTDGAGEEQPDPPFGIAVKLL